MSELNPLLLVRKMVNRHQVLEPIWDRNEQQAVFDHIESTCWRSVEEQPPVDTMLTAYSEFDGIFRGKVDEYGDWSGYTNGGWHEIKRVTHWMYGPMEPDGACPF